MGLQQREEGQKQSAVEATFIKPLGRDVRGCHQHKALGEERLEEAGQNHRIRNIGDGAFIEAEELCFRRDGGGHGGDGVGVLHLAGFDALTVGVDAVMHIGHEVLEMHALFVRRGGGLQHQIHQHGFAAAHRAIEIEPLGRLGLAAQAAEKAGRLRLIGGQKLAERIHLGECVALRLVGLDRA